MDLTCQYENQALLVEGPEVMIRPVGARPQSMRSYFAAAELQAMIDLNKSGATAEQVAQTYGFSKRSVNDLTHLLGERAERSDRRPASANCLAALPPRQLPDSAPALSTCLLPGWLWRPALEHCFRLA